MPNRNAPLDLDPQTFREAGHALVERIAQHLEELSQGPVTPAEDAEAVRAALRAERGMPEKGMEPKELVAEAAELVLRHSLFNGHPGFMGFITSSPAPIGVLGDMLAATANPNVGGWVLSPVATEMELQTIRWIAELLGYPSDCGGLLVSGGNMANFVGFLAARKAKATWDIRKEGAGAPGAHRMRAYASAETHTWLQKAGDLFGLGGDAVRWIETDAEQRIDLKKLEAAIAKDRKDGDLPFFVAGSAGTVSTGALDPLRDLADLAQREDMWFHVDGAYGAAVAMLPEAHPDFRAIGRADSVAFDPHKWLYAPLEAGCALVRTPQHLIDTFSYRPPYYPIDFERTNFYEYGPQNSRGFRALKVWLGLRQAGREGYTQMMRDDIALAKRLFERCHETEEIEARTYNLSIATFRFVPSGLSEEEGTYLDDLNRKILERLNAEGKVFVSNAVIEGRFYLRACVVNFRTTESVVDTLPGQVRELGIAIHREMRPPATAGS